MKAFHNDPTIKEKYLARVRAHRLADEIIHGSYWTGSKGCAVGCTIHSPNHSAYAIDLGIPQVLARLEDSIFEGLPNDLSMLWPERFLSAITPGADLSLVWPKWAVWMLTDSQWGVLQFAKTVGQMVAIQRVSDMYTKIIAGKSISRINWRDAYYYDAAAANADAADAAADAAAAAAAAAATAAAARYKWRIAQSDKLIELLEAAT
jgi:hypothetical protein